MKLATLKDGSRDGLLVVVSRDLSQAHHAAHVAGTLQQVLDDWNFCSPQLQTLYETLNAGKARHAFAFDPRQCMAPLPRAQCWVAAQAYPSHLQRLCGELGLQMPQERPASLQELAPMQTRSSAMMCGAHETFTLGTQGAGGGIDIEPGLAVLTAELPQGCEADEATEAVRLLMMINGFKRMGAVQAAAVGADEDSVADADQGAGAAQPAAQSELQAYVGATSDVFLGAACSPVVVTPEELGAGWRDGKLQGTLESRVNGRLLGRCDTAAGMHLGFGQLLTQRAAASALPAGCILSGGTVSIGSPGQVEDSRQLATCVVEQRFLRNKAGATAQAFLAPGDTVRIDFLDEAGVSVFGAIQQQLRLAGSAATSTAEALPLPLPEPAAIGEPAAAEALADPE